mmetsp:Transcript_39043/g.101160  ORF Transcript_39043/g.101160 Transcript_39043/m.101160 type:complete len:207 (-) Transcript_39043:390-1010(-)
MVRPREDGVGRGVACADERALPALEAAAAARGPGGGTRGESAAREGRGDGRPGPPRHRRRQQPGLASAHIRDVPGRAANAARVRRGRGGAVRPLRLRDAGVQAARSHASQQPRAPGKRQAPRARAHRRARGRAVGENGFRASGAGELAGGTSESRVDSYEGIRGGGPPAENAQQRLRVWPGKHVVVHGAASVRQEPAAGKEHRLLG